MAPDAKARPSWVCSSISVVVRAENEDDQKYEWSECLPVSDPVKKLADAWAQAHGVPPSAVGFDDANGCEVDLLQTPLSLGWVPGSEVVLTAFPTEDRFMEQIANEGEDGEDDAPERTPGGDSGALVLETPAKKVPSPKQVQGQPWNPQSVPSEETPVPVAAPVRREAHAQESRLVASAATASSDLRRPAPLAEVEPAPASRSATRGAAAEGNNNGSHSRARGQQEPRKEPRRSRGGGARGAGSPKGRGRGAAAAAADGGGRGGSAAAVSKAAAAKAPASQIDSASTPTEEEAIVFEQANPKKEGSSAYQRYERYKRARTVSEALVLGAAKGDIAHDFKRGFLKRRRGG